jgi:hypothetical protein
MPLQGEAKTLYQRDYMRRRRAGLRARVAPAKPEPRPTYESRLRTCSFCGAGASTEHPLVKGAAHVHICEDCAREAAALLETVTSSSIDQDRPATRSIRQTSSPAGSRR